MSYGCHNRPPLKTTMKVQAGTWQEPAPDGVSWMRRQAIKEIPIQTSLNCQYSKDNPGDQQCDGCSNQHRKMTT